jgi:hypothetical protein
LAHGTLTAVVDTLRLRISQEHGKGWSVREIGATDLNPVGRAQLTSI